MMPMYPQREEASIGRSRSTALPPASAIAAVKRPYSATHGTATARVPQRSTQRLTSGRMSGEAMRGMLRMVSVCDCDQPKSRATGPTKNVIVALEAAGLRAMASTHAIADFHAAAG